MLTEPATSRLEGTPWGLESCTQRAPAGTWDGLRGTMCPEEKAGPQASGAEALGCSVTVSRGGMNGTGEFLIDLKAQAPPNAWAYPKKGRVRGQGLADHTGSCDSLSRSTQGCHDFTFQSSRRRVGRTGIGEKLISLVKAILGYIENLKLAWAYTERWMSINQGAICGM